ARGVVLAAAFWMFWEGGPRELGARRPDAAGLRQITPKASLVFISPFGQTGPQANDPATDLTLFFASGMARLLTGQVDDLAEPPMRPVGEQSAFIRGVCRRSHDDASLLCLPTQQAHSLCVRVS